MKIALSLSGYFDSGKDESSKGIDGFQYIFKELLNKFDIDVYIHSWDIKNKNNIENLYDEWLVDSKFEPQIDFKPLFYKNKLNEYKIHATPFYNVFSQYFSVQESFRLIKSNNIKYDCVIKGRFDLGRINRSGNSPMAQAISFIKTGTFLYPVQCINFNPNLDMSFFYLAKWSEKFFNNEGPADMWFYSSYDNMMNFCDLFSLLSKDIKKGGEYERWANGNDGGIVNGIKGWKWFLMNKKLWSKKKPLSTKWK